MKDKSGEERGAPPKAPSANDVASLAGVSRTQVSYVLNGTGEAHVSKEKRERILAAVRELGYRPHPSAQSLRQGFSREFCIFFPVPYPSGINSLLGRIHEIGLPSGCVVAQYSWNGYRDPRRMKESFETMLARQPMGIFCSLLDLDRRDIDAAKARGIQRMLVLDVEPHDDLDTFFLPKEEVGRLAASYLLGLGHRKVAVLRPSDPVQRRPFRLCFKGMRRAASSVAGADLAVRDWPKESIQPTLEAARRFVAELRSGGDLPTAIYAHSDDYAIPLLRALHESGIKVPKQISVLGTDDLAISEATTPTLSSIGFDGPDLGLRAVKMISSLITGEPLEEEFRLPPHPLVVERESTR